VPNPSSTPREPEKPVMTTESSTLHTDGTINFAAHWLPPLMAGEYTITVTQRLANTDTTAEASASFDETFVNTSTFAVRGERFSLNPSELVSQFPPANNQGEYQNVLPHVVLARRTLPWERSPELNADTNSWLALLLFEQDEAPPLQSAQVGDLQRHPFWRSAEAAKAKAPQAASSLPVGTASYPDGYALLPAETDGKPPVFALAAGENWWDPCQVIDVPARLFAAITPSLSELGWLAHARTVALASKSGPNDAESTGSFSVIVGNRLPAPNTLCTVHLVSLEGLARFLPTADGETAAKLTLAGGGTADTIRLVSLASWSFTSQDPAETFTGYLEALDCAPLQRPAPATTATAATQTVAGAFAMGYTAMNHHGRLGDDTVSWYRGPLLPYTATAAIVPPPGGAPVAVADQAVRFDPATGMMDVTYAAAWQIGRSAGLQSGIYSTSLYAWKRAAARSLAQAAEAATVADSLPSLTQSDRSLAAATPMAVLGAAQLRGLAIGLIAETLAAHLARPLTQTPEKAQ